MISRMIFSLVVLFTCTVVNAGQSINVYNWSEYLPQEVIDLFTRETGVEVNYSTYDSNEVMYAKMKTLHAAGSGKGDYDLVVPSNYYISRMAGEGLLAELDHKLLPNLKNIDPKLLDRPFDPANKYSIPYLWGTTGIGVNIDSIASGSITSWADLWKEEFKNNVLLLDDMREVMSLGLFATGYSINDRDPAHIEEAYNKLTELLPNVRLFDAESPKVKLLEGEVRLGMLWSGEAYMAELEEAGVVEYIYPSEGAVLWIDNMAIPSSARYPELAHKFIDFMMRPEIAMMITEEIGYASPNLEAIKLLPQKVRENRTVYPSAADLKNAQMQEAVGDALPVYEKFWQKLKVAE